MNEIAEPIPGIFPVRLVIESKTNPRKTFLNMDELTASVKRVGILQPVLLRTVRDQVVDEGDEPIVELVAGARRLRAAKAAGLEVIPGLLRDLDDIEVAEIQLIENIQREDVNEYEEAESFRLLMAEHKKTADDIAQMISQSRSYVFGRLQLLKLSNVVRGICLEGGLPASIALLIARLSSEVMQESAAREIAKGNGVDGPMSVRQAATYIKSRYMLELLKAPFSISSFSLLESAGSCSECPKRTGNQPELYSDTSPDVCTDPDCFDAKKVAHHVAAVSLAESSGKEIVKATSPWAVSVKEGHVHALKEISSFERIKVKGKTPVGQLLNEDQLPQPVSYIKTDQKLYPVYEKSAIQAALEKAGLCDTLAKHSAAMREKLSPKESAAQIAAQTKGEERKQAAETENKIRLAGYKLVRAECIAEEGLSLPMLRAIVKALMTDMSLTSELHDIYEFKLHEVNKFIDQASAPEVEALLMDLLIGRDLNVGTWELNEDNTLPADNAPLWDALTAACRIDVQSLRHELSKERAPKEPELDQQVVKKVVKAKVAKPMIEKLKIDEAASKKKVAKKAAKSPARPKSASTIAKVAKAKPATANELLNPAAAWPFPTSKN